jgi:hypothetical protein
VFCLFVCLFGCLLYFFVCLFFICLLVLNLFSLFRMLCPNIIFVFFSPSFYFFFPTIQGDESMWRKASILADATMEIVKSEVTGQALIDEVCACSWAEKDLVSFLNILPPNNKGLSERERMDRLQAV